MCCDLSTAVSAAPPSKYQTVCQSTSDVIMLLLQSKIHTAFTLGKVQISLPDEWQDTFNKIFSFSWICRRSVKTYPNWVIILTWIFWATNAKHMVLDWSECVFWHPYNSRFSFALAAQHHHKQYEHFSFTVQNFTRHKLNLIKHFFAVFYVLTILCFIYKLVIELMLKCYIVTRTLP